MATRLLERVPTDRIQAEARPVDLGRLLMVVIVGVFYALGFVARKAVRLVGTELAGFELCLGWAVRATLTGWQEAALSAEERRRARAA